MAFVLQGDAMHLKLPHAPSAAEAPSFKAGKKVKEELLYFALASEVMTVFFHALYEASRQTLIVAA